MSAIVVDTSAYSAWVRGDSAAVEVMAAATGFDVPVIVVGELLGGFRGGTREHENRQRLRIFLRQPSTEIIPITPHTAEAYAELISFMKKSGINMPANDVWIAAVAVSSSTPLWTYDRHFAMIAGLKLVQNVSDLET